VAVVLAPASRVDPPAWVAALVEVVAEPAVVEEEAVAVRQRRSS